MPPRIASLGRRAPGVTVGQKFEPEYEIDRKLRQFLRVQHLTARLPPPRFPSAPRTEHRRLMAPRSAPASAEVNREAGRRGNRLGAFSLVPRLRPPCHGRPRHRLSPCAASSSSSARSSSRTRCCSARSSRSFPGYVDEFGLSKLQAGLLVGAFGAGACSAAFPAASSRHADRPEERPSSLGLLPARARDLRVRARRLAATLGVARFAPGPLERA